MPEVTTPRGLVVFDDIAVHKAPPFVTGGNDDIVAVFANEYDEVESEVQPLSVEATVYKWYVDYDYVAHTADGPIRDQLKH